MFQRVPPADPFQQLSRSESAHLSTMRAILDEGLLSPLSTPSKVSLTDGIRVESIAQAHSIITKYLHPLGAANEANPSENLILSIVQSSHGNFLVSLPVEDCRQTAISPHFPTIEMRPVGPLGWKLIVGDGVEQPDILHSVGAHSLRVGERLSFPLSPIPNMKGASGFCASAARDALRASPLFADKLQYTEEKDSPDMIIATDHGRFKISSSLAFWVHGNVLHHDGHYAFAPELYPQLRQHKAQLRVDITPLSDQGTELLYVKSPPSGTTEVLTAISRVIADNFCRRSSNRKTRVAELISA